MSEIRLEDLSKEQLDALMKQAEERKLAEEAKKREDKEAYAELVDATVRANYVKLQELSEAMQAVKEEVYNDFKKVLELKNDLYNVKDDQQTHTFTTADGKLSIELGYRTINDYDSTLSAGIAKIKTYIGSLASEDKNPELIQMVNLLLRLDKNGNLKPSRVMELSNLANQIDNTEFREGVAILQQSYQPRRSSTFISARENEETGRKYLPLSMSRS